MTVLTQGMAGRPAERSERGLRVRVTPELLLYAGIALLALTVRLTLLGAAPLDDAEARQALAALRTVNPHATGDVTDAQSPLLFTLNAITFALIPGGGDFAARWPAALGGVLLVLTPALWRRYVGVLPALIMAGILTLSPVGLLASRTLSAATWTLTLALLVPWLALRFAETGDARWALAATVGALAMALLTEPSGFLVLQALAFGVLFALLTAPPDEAELTQAVRRTLRAWPWARGLGIGALVVLGVATLLYWLPSGLTVVGNVIAGALRGFAERRTGAPVAFPLWVALRYEAGLALFGLIGAWRAVRRGGFFERALVGWLLGGLLWAVGYAGADAAHALWLTVPLSALVALTVADWITERPSVAWHVPEWGVPLHALITFGLWLAVGLSLVLLGKRLLLDVPQTVTDWRALVRALTSGVYNRSVAQPQAVQIGDATVQDFVLGFMQLRLLITVLVTMLNGVLFFLIGSLWGARAAWRGFALGTLAFALFFGAGLGGREAFGTPAGDPRAFWHADPVTADLHELRDTLHTMSLRATGEPNLIAVTANVPPDGAVAWALRDFPHVQFVDGVGPEVTSAVVLMPDVFPRVHMGADYVGKDLITRQGWGTSQLSWRDAILWFYRNESAQKPAPTERLMLWVRKDVYGVEQVIEK